jgi:hypothetical protein
MMLYPIVVRGEFRPKDVAGATGVGEEMAYGNFRSNVLVRVIGQVAADRSIQRQFPAFTSCRIATEVNILFADPNRNRVLVVTGILVSRSARPQLFSKMMLPFREISIVPDKRSSAASASARSVNAFSAASSVRRGSAKSGGPGNGD